jgi:hypothetical protein
MFDAGGPEGKIIKLLCPKPLKGLQSKIVERLSEKKTASLVIIKRVAILKDDFI